jgi:hypothetical protein
MNWPLAYVNAYGHGFANGGFGWREHNIPRVVTVATVFFGDNFTTLSVFRLYSVERMTTFKGFRRKRSWPIRDTVLEFA